nr:EOG090X043H [Leptodora kindtii]
MSNQDSRGERWPVFLVASTGSLMHGERFIKRDPVQVERTNLVNLCKLIVKELIDSSVQYGRMLDSDFVPLQHFFIVLEHAFRHGLRPKKGLLGPKKELWDLLQSIEKYTHDAHDITASVRDLPTVKTSLGRARAWIRLALMQKKLADYIKILLDHRDSVLAEFYEPGSLLLSDESVVLLGLLLGLNVVDCNLCLKEEDLDTQQGVIDFSLYLRSGASNSSAPAVDAVESASMTAVLDQKNYVEELNRHLSATITNLQSRLDATTTSHTLIKEELTLTKMALEKAQEENSILKQDFESNNIFQLLIFLVGHMVLPVSLTCKKKKKIKDDAGMPQMDSLRTSKRSSTYLASEDAIAEVKMQLAEEKNRRLDLEKELELQTCMRAETEVALKLLEKDIHEKQDTIVSLRRQLDDIKIINLEMYRKMQDLEKSLLSKEEQLKRLEKAKCELEEQQKQCQVQLEECRSGLKRNEENARRCMEERLEAQTFCRTLEEDLRLEREWRQSLQDSIVQDRTVMAELKQQFEDSKESISEYCDLREKHQRMLKVCIEQEKTLEEVGIRLRDTKLEADNLKETTVWMPRDAQWAPDEDVTNCRLCEKDFNLSRRKHHCRSCGEIFCSSCSDNKMPLPSSAKPVRVCDTCHTHLLQRYSAIP